MKFFDRSKWCWLLRHTPNDPSPCRTESDLVNIPTYKRCKHCAKNLGELL